MTNAATRLLTSCQVCSGPIQPALFLGYHPPVNQMLRIGDPVHEQPSYPSRLMYCERCTLVQLELQVDPRVLFPPEYPYTSGTTKILRDNFQDLFEEARRLLSLPTTDLVVDVGSNDGTLLSNWARAGHRVMGIEPSLVANIANERGIRTRMAFFTPELARVVRAEEGPARVVTATNVFAHMQDVHRVLDGILDMLADDGVFISESHYLPSLLETLQYDTIYHEHLRYYSLSSLSHLLDAHGLEVIHARPIPTHGGSIRVYAARRGKRAVSESVGHVRASESAAPVTLARLERFREDVVISKLSLLSLLFDLRRRGKRIFGIGAPSRASTLVNYVGLDDGVLEAVMEVPGSLKLGHYLPGTLVPVLEEGRLYRDQPDFALLLSWHIAEELMPKLRQKGFRGGFIVPLPQPRIVEAPAG